VTRRRSFPQYLDDVGSGLADECFCAVDGHDVCELLNGCRRVVYAMCPEISLVSDPNGTARELFVRRQRAGWTWIHCAEVYARCPPHL
jgi:hypothetical protein